MKKAHTIQINKFNFLVGFLKGSLGLLLVIAGGVLCSTTYWSGLGLAAGVTLGVFGSIKLLDGIKDLRDSISREEVSQPPPTHRRASSDSRIAQRQREQPATSSIEPVRLPEPRVNAREVDDQTKTNQVMMENTADEKKWYSGLMTFFGNTEPTRETTERLGKKSFTA